MIFFMSRLRKLGVKGKFKKIKNDGGREIVMGISCVLSYFRQDLIYRKLTLPALQRTSLGHLIKKKMEVKDCRYLNDLENMPSEWKEKKNTLETIELIPVLFNFLSQ